LDARVTAGILNNVETSSPYGDPGDGIVHFVHFYISSGESNTGFVEAIFHGDDVFDLFLPVGVILPLATQVTKEPHADNQSHSENFEPDHDVGFLFSDGGTF